MPQVTTAETPPGADDADRLVHWEGPPVPNPRRRGGPWPVRFYRTSTGKKWAMAVTGLVMLLWLFGHAIGNLKMYLGAAEFDHYAEFLREMLYPVVPKQALLWLIRAAMIVAIVVHVQAASALTLQNHRSRRVRYQSHRDYVAANFASRTMRWTGIIIGLFILWHLADLTFGWVNPDFVSGEVYNNVDASLSRWPVAIFYMVAMLAVGIHLWHGIWSACQTLGWNNPRYNASRRWIATVLAVTLTAINISFPIAVLAGVVGQ